MQYITISGSRDYIYNNILEYKYYIMLQTGLDLDYTAHAHIYALALDFTDYCL